MQQLVASQAHNPKVVGSSPTPATFREVKYLPFQYLNMEDKALLKEDYPDILGDWMWESDYLVWKKYCEDRRKQFEDWIFGKEDNGRQIDSKQD